MYVRSVLSYAFHPSFAVLTPSTANLRRLAQTRFSAVRYSVHMWLIVNGLPWDRECLSEKFVAIHLSTSGSCKPKPHVLYMYYGFVLSQVIRRRFNADGRHGTNMAEPAQIRVKPPFRFSTTELPFRILS